MNGEELKAEERSGEKEEKNSLSFIVLACSLANKTWPKNLGLTQVWASLFIFASQPASPFTFVRSLISKYDSLGHSPGRRFCIDVFV